MRSATIHWSDRRLPGLLPAWEADRAPAPLWSTPEGRARLRATLGVVQRSLVGTAAVFLVSIAGGLLTLAMAPRVLGYPSVVVVSGSMAPSLRPGDVVVLTRQPVDEIEVGAVISYRVDGGQRIHRIIERTDAGFTTKGDANSTADSGIVDGADVTGVGIYVVPFIGFPKYWAGEGSWARLVAAAAGIAAAVRLSLLPAARRPRPGPPRFAGGLTVRHRFRTVGP